MISQSLYPSTIQRALEAARTVTVNRGDNQRTISPDDVTLPMAAATYGISRQSVERALAVSECVSDEPLRQLEAGEVSLKEAADIARKLGRAKMDRQRRSSEIFTIIVL